MSLDDMKSYMRNGAIKGAMIAAAVTATVEAKAQTQNDDDKHTKAKTEQTVIAPQTEKKDEKSINFFDVANITQVKQDKQTYHILDEKAVISPEMLDEKKLKKDFKKGEKELRENADEDRIHKDTVLLSKADYAGIYTPDSKNITIPYIENDLQKKVTNAPNEEDGKLAKYSNIFKRVENLNNQTSPDFLFVKTHEEQHRTNDKLGSYAPGLSPEQYAIVNQYDEVAANVAGLNVYVNAYQEKLKAGASKEEALSVFDTDEEFHFYRDAIAKGLDPESKEGKALMVSGYMQQWKKETSQANIYRDQMHTIAVKNMHSNSFQGIVLGNEKETQKRVEKIFDNILIDGKPTKMSQYIPAEKPELSDEIRKNIANDIKEKIGLDAEDRKTIAQTIEGKNDKQKSKNLLKALTGRVSPEKVSKPKQDQGLEKTDNKTTTPVKDNTNQY